MRRCLDVLTTGALLLCILPAALLLILLTAAWLALGVAIALVLLAAELLWPGSTRRLGGA